ncbi:hypothetical protein EDM56_02030 [Brevibacillus fluminis]|uniref:Tyr recombinase domain-containing protein n=1 Tax=Brevibacillus fluminis TaxID=511487 RepID=A0A3M8DWJ5_9BACL|nr:tyrosine-type recombinase/integrase [Brevibacillus fluminis]RNB92496.1 hypothetical protein EDM56_02030 [Brevibacillus fluminis]
MPITKNRPPDLSRLNRLLQKVLSEFGHETFMKALHSSGITVDDSTPSNCEITYRDAVDYFLTCPTFLALSASSKRTYLSEVKSLSSFTYAHLGADPQLIEASTSTLLLEYISRSTNPNTKAKKCAFLRTFFSAISRRFNLKLLDDLKPLLKMKWRKDDLQKGFSKIQLAEMLSLSQMSRDGHRNSTIIWTFLGTGLRLNELLHLQIGDIAEDTQTVYIIPKGDDETKVPRKITKLALTLLQDYISFKYSYLRETLPAETYKNLYIFSNNLGRNPLSSRTIQFMVKSLVNQAKSIPEHQKEWFSPHSFRHSFAIYGLESGIDIYTLSKLLGHKSIGSTIVYLNLFDHQLKTAIEQHPFAKSEYKTIQERLGTHHEHNTDI